MNRLPLLVIGGYLGAGKTTLIRHLLENNRGLRLLVLVNDFGAINIDADLIAHADGDTIALSNGCVCCSMSGDLYFAIGDAIDRRPRPDLVVIEASGVGDPARIARVARTEHELEYGGIVTVVDAQAIGDLLTDGLIGPQVEGQIRVADLILLSKTDLCDASAAVARLAAITDAPTVPAVQGHVDPALLTGLQAADPEPIRDAHHGADYVTWSGHAQQRVQAERAQAFLASLPDGIFRAKGWLSLVDRTIELHRVGRQFHQVETSPRADCQLVAIAPAGRFDPSDVQQAWERMLSD